MVDGLVRITIAGLLKFSGWRMSVALGGLSIAFGLFHLQPWPTWYAGTVGYCIGMEIGTEIAARRDPDPAANDNPDALED